MKILICGDRNYKNWEKIQNYLNTLDSETIIIHGCAKGADSLAGNLANGLGLNILRFPADWDTHGRAAGPIRNQQMLDEGQPDLVVYFHDDIENSKGTNDMITRAKKNKVKVIDNPQVVFDPLTNKFIGIDSKLMEDWNTDLLETVGEDTLSQIMEIQKGPPDADVL